jgi:hypothetical protein
MRIYYFMNPRNAPYSNKKALGCLQVHKIIYSHHIGTNLKIKNFFLGCAAISLIRNKRSLSLSKTKEL